MPSDADIETNSDLGSNPLTRSFIGLPLAEDLSASLAAHIKLLRKSSDVQKTATDVRWTPESNWHVTLAFLGDQSPQTLLHLQRDLEQLCHVASGVSSDITCLTRFPDAKSRIFAALLDPSDSLIELQRNVSRLCDERGIALDTRQFKPHIILARFKPNQARIDAESFLEQPWRCSAQWLRVNLYASRLTPQGSVYQALSQFALSQPAN